MTSKLGTEFRFDGSVDESSGGLPPMTLSADLPGGGVWAPLDFADDGLSQQEYQNEVLPLISSRFQELMAADPDTTQESAFTTIAVEILMPRTFKHEVYFNSLSARVESLVSSVQNLQNPGDGGL